MCEELEKPINKIRHIARIKQMLMLRGWRRKAAESSVPGDVRAGYVAICVGSRYRRFVVRAKYLNHPVFEGVLSEAGEEYGFGNDGPLSLPNCDESVFEDMIRFVSRRTDSAAAAAKPARMFHPRHRDQLYRCFAGESRPLLHHKTHIC